MQRLIPAARAARGEALHTIQDSFESCPDWPPCNITRFTLSRQYTFNYAINRR